MKQLLLAMICAAVIMTGCDKKGTPPSLPPSPSISSFSPLSARAGSAVTITGANFSATASENAVKFNDVTATVTDASTTELTVTVPNDAISGKITVTVNDKTGSSAVSFTFIGAPTIASFAPEAAIHGTTITITGTNFSPVPEDNLVTINDVMIPVTDATTTELKITLPKDHSCSGDIEVKVNGKKAKAAKKFAYIYKYILAAMNGVSFPMQSVVDRDGNIIVAEGIGGRISKLSPQGTLSTIINVASPSGIAIDNSGNIIYSSLEDHSIYRVSEGVATKIAGSDGEGFAEGAALTSASFNTPAELAVTASGDIIVVDTNNNRIRKISNGIVSTIAGGGSSDQDGPAANSKLYLPHGITISPSGDIYITDWGKKRIRKISDGTITTVAGGQYGTIDGTGAEAGFDSPFGITFNLRGDLLVSEWSSGKIRRITRDGVVTTATCYTDPATLTEASFGNLTGILVDAKGVIYLNDTSEGKIYKIVEE